MKLKTTKMLFKFVDFDSIYNTYNILFKSEDNVESKQ